MHLSIKKLVMILRRLQCFSDIGGITALLSGRGTRQQKASFPASVRLHKKQYTFFQRDIAKLSRCLDFFQKGLRKGKGAIGIEG
jgi:hypothetical protein